MEARESIKTTNISLIRDLTRAVWSYLDMRRTLVVVAIVAAVGGIALNWSWLVVGGIAPILLSTLPCLVMCGLGYCMMCRSNKTQSSASREIANSTTSSTALGDPEVDRPTVGGSSCCNERVSEAPPPQVKQLQPTEERRDSHA